MDAHEVLRKAREIITPRDRWCVGLQSMGRAHCALGAVAAAEEGSWFGYTGYSDAQREAVETLASLVDREQLKPDPYNAPTGSPANIVANYNNTNSHECVLTWFDAAIERTAR